jgi:hypothetical protein
VITYRSVWVPLDAAQTAKWKVRLAEPSGNLFALGTCPTCSVPLELPLPKEVVTTAAAGGGTTRLTRTLHCNCTEPHADRPSTTPVGCGRSWSLTVVQEGDQFTVEPAAVDMIQAANELARVGATQVDALRASAEKWLGGVTAILGLLGIAGVAVGKDGVASLATAPKVAAGFAIGCAVIAAAFAIVRGYEAAYGWPRPADVSSDDLLREWFRQWSGRAVAAGGKLKQSIVASVVALGLLATTVGIIWFGASAAAPTAKVTVDYNENSDAGRPGSVCGVLVASERPELRVKITDGPTARTQIVPVSWVTKVAPAKKC